MSQQVLNLTCPSCGAPASTTDKNCVYCEREIVISSFSSVSKMLPSEVTKYANVYKKTLAQSPRDGELNNSLAMCYLKLRLYDKASISFDTAIEANVDNSETYFYAAICLLKGQKAFLSLRPIIDRIEEYINAAIMIEPKAIYYYFQAYIKYDYYSRKFFNTSPTYQEAYQQAIDAGLSDCDIEQIYSVMGVARPECL